MQKSRKRKPEKEKKDVNGYVEIKMVGSNSWIHSFVYFQFEVLSSNLSSKKLFSTSIAGISFQEPSPPKKTKAKAKPKVTTGWSSTLLQFYVFHPRIYPP